MGKGYGIIRDSSSLDDDAQDEHSGSDQDPVFSACRLGDEARDHGAEPGSQFEDTGKPTFAGLVCRKGGIIMAHVLESVLAFSLFNFCLAMIT
jgi:hypothetical protein